MTFPKKKAFTLVEIMIVVAILGIIVAIAIPTFFRARENARLRACQENLTKLDGAKQTWAIDQRQLPTAIPEWTDIVGTDRYIRRTPVCPSGGTYTLNAVHDLPTCSLSNQTPLPHNLDILPTGILFNN